MCISVVREEHHRYGVLLILYDHYDALFLSVSGFEREYQLCHLTTHTS